MEKADAVGGKTKIVHSIKTYIESPLKLRISVTHKSGLIPENFGELEGVG